MRPIFIATLAAAAAMAPLPASAQDIDRYANTDTAIAAGELADRLSDPIEQERLADTLAVMSEILLDLPIAPLARAMEDATGGPIGDVDPDTTLRSLAGPDADRVPGELERHVPQAMDAMAGVADSVAVMSPMLREMAERMRGVLDDYRR